MYVNLIKRTVQSSRETDLTLFGQCDDGTRLTGWTSTDSIDRTHLELVGLSRTQTLHCVLPCRRRHIGRITLPRWACLWTTRS